MYNPFTGFRVTQGYHSLHRAIDYGMNVGTPLPACSSGRVVYEWFTFAGFTATIHRPDGSYTRYAHGSKHGNPASHAIRQGELVKMLSGNSGVSTGPHLHVFDQAADGTRRPPFTTGLQFAGDAGTPSIDGSKPSTIEEEEEDMAQGAFYRNKTSGGIFWQEKPNTPLTPLDLTTWVAYAANGNKYADLSAGDVDALIAKWGTVAAPVAGFVGDSSVLLAAVGKLPTAEQVAVAVNVDAAKRLAS